MAQPSGASFALLLALGLGASACAPPRPASARPAVAASIFPLFDLARRVAGPDVEVLLALPPGQGEHAFDPRPRDVARLAGVDLAFGIGLGLDPWLPRLLAGATDGRARVLDLGPRLDPRPVPAHVLMLVEGEAGEEAGPADPHVFLDPVRMAAAAPLLADALAERDPGRASAYRDRAREVKAQLESLHGELQARQRRWRQRRIVTFHGSFFYFAERYGLEVTAVVEPLAGREPSPRYVARVLQALRGSGAGAIFTEPQLDPVPARLMAQESGLPLFELDPVGGGPGAESYEAWQRKNAAVLDEALR